MKSIGVLAFLLIVFLAVNVSSYEYQIPFYSGNSDASIITIEGLSLTTNDNCEVTLTDIVNISDGDNNYDVSVTYFSPANDVVGTGAISGIGNRTCFDLFFGSSSDSQNGIYEGYTEIIHTGTSVYSIIEMYYDCSESNNYINLTVDPIALTDTYGNIPLRFSKTNTQNNPISKNSTMLGYIYNYTDCYSEFEPTGYQFYTGSTALPGEISRVLALYYPFNASSKFVNYYFSLGNNTDPLLECTAVDSTRWGSVNLLLVNLEDQSFDTLYSVRENCDQTPYQVTGNIQGTLSGLNRDEIYFFYLLIAHDDEAIGNQRSYEMREPDDVNIDIFVYEGDFVCSAWSDCEGGQQLRTCVDQNGIAPNEFESRTCDVSVIENASLGFEAFVRESDIWKCIPQWISFPPCSYFLNQTYRDTPVNWSIAEFSNAKRDFLRMTEEWSTEGSRSLKMWYIPPKMGEVTLNGSSPPTGCGNSTSGTVPFITQNISNGSFSVYYDVTFPGENMILSFDTKGCISQSLQHSAIRDTLLNITNLCNERCYSSSCSGIPDSRYVFNLLDTSTGLSVLGSPYFDTASINLTDQISIDISNLGIVSGINYTIVFSVYPENLDDASGNCVYFDNVRYERTEQSLIDSVLNGVCVSRCVSGNFYSATLLSGGECSVVRTEFAPECQNLEIASRIESGLDVCDPESETLLRMFNSKTGKHEEFECQYGCENNACITETESQQDQLSTSLYLPHIIVQSILNEWLLPYEGNEIVWFFNSLFMYINYLALGLAFGVSLVVRGNSKDAKDLYIPFIITIVIVLVSSTFGGFYPLEVGIPIIVFIGILLWKTSEGIVGGHGRGGG